MGVFLFLLERMAEELMVVFCFFVFFGGGGGVVFAQLDILIANCSSRDTTVSNRVRFKKSTLGVDHY